MVKTSYIEVTDVELKVGKIPKKYQKMVREYYVDEDGFWLILNEGYIEPDMDSRTIHEEDHSQILEKLKTCIKE